MDTDALTIATHFAPLIDPRVERTRVHNLIDVIVIAIAAVVAGADSWNDIEEYGKSKEAWLRGFLELPGAIPSHDTFSRIFARLDPGLFHSCFLGWLTAASKIVKGVIPIDGKTMRGSGSLDMKAPLHLVQAWSVENSLVLGQIRVADKSNEIDAIPELLKILDVAGCLVTIDAIGCQRKIAAQIKAADGDYVIAVKGNQPTLSGQIRLSMEAATSEILTSRAGRVVETLDKGHGRLEQRSYWLFPATGIVDCAEDWQGLAGIGVAESTVEHRTKTTIERRYFIVSFDNDVERFARAVRSHWTIESTLHWTLDMSFAEDRSRIRKDHSPDNMATLRRTALSLLKQAETTRTSVRGRRLTAGWNDDYMYRVLFERSKAKEASILPAHRRPS